MSRYSRRLPRRARLLPITSCVPFSLRSHLCLTVEVDSMQEIVRKLRRQGYEVLHKPRVPGESAINGVADPELDRLGGKTRLISTSHEPGRSYHFGTACVPSPGSSSTTSSSSAGNACMPVHPDMIHPTIRQDLRVFEGADVAAWIGPTSSSSSSMEFNFEMFNPQPAAMQPQQQPQQPAQQGQPIPVQQTAPAVPSHISVPSQLPGPGPDIFDDLFGAQAFPPESEQPAGPPVQLDATWQSFIEQLGF